MRDMTGGSYRHALTGTFMSELLSMNLLMTGMVPTMMILKRHIAAAADPTMPAFWFVMSMALLVGFVFAYPMNWWLVANHLKHGMMTARSAGSHAAGALAHGANARIEAAATGGSAMHMPMSGSIPTSMSDIGAPWPPVAAMAVL
jgi:hypothetical protein